MTLHISVTSPTSNPPSKTTTLRVSGTSLQSLMPNQNIAEFKGYPNTCLIIFNHSHL
ncbi:hypothetical protein HanRHA438_Chr13g0629541 [Helianthus annuus]|nr:hypothetical protein HanRHA438_Chr13g0629541 [Helianthus annuus]